MNRVAENNKEGELPGNLRWKDCSQLLLALSKLKLFNIRLFELIEDEFLSQFHLADAQAIIKYAQAH